MRVRESFRPSMRPRIQQKSLLVRKPVESRFRAVDPLNHGRSHLGSGLDAVIDPNARVRVPGDLELSLEGAQQSFVGSMHASMMSDGVLRDAVPLDAHVDQRRRFMDVQVSPQNRRGHRRPLFLVRIRRPAIPPVSTYHDGQLGPWRRTESHDSIRVEDDAQRALRVQIVRDRPWDQVAESMHGQ